jgi:hypothetical protein
LEDIEHFFRKKTSGHPDEKVARENDFRTMAANVFDGNVVSRFARFFLVRTYQNEKNIPINHTLPNCHKIYQTVLNISKGHKIYQHFPFQGPPNCTQIGIFGMKINHLATLVVS